MACNGLFALYTDLNSQTDLAVDANCITCLHALYTTVQTAGTREINISILDLHVSIVFSLNPEIDIGQAEGAFVFGLGCFLSEHFMRDPNTGQLLTKNTWVCVLVHCIL
jgi:hypothetical protein